VLLAAGSAAGLIRDDVAAEDLLTALSGVTLAAGDAERRDQAGRLLDLLMDGLRRRSEVPAPGRRAGDGTSRPAGPPGGS
jgi:hypothetical protein